MSYAIPMSTGRHHLSAIPAHARRTMRPRWRNRTRWTYAALIERLCALLVEQPPRRHRRVPTPAERAAVVRRHTITTMSLIVVTSTHTLFLTALLFAVASAR